MPRTVISYGGGVQSTAMLVLAAQGAIDSTEALFCNVGDDSEAVETLRYVREIAIPYAAAHGIAVHEIRRTRRDGTTPTLLEYHLEQVERTGATPLPVKMQGAGDGGIANRTCTVEWKAKPVRQWLRKHGATKAAPVHLALGISTDEIHRANNRNDQPYELRTFPLLDLGLSRNDCTAIIRRAGLPVPPKSACWFCPFIPPARLAEMRRDNPARFDAIEALETGMNKQRDRLGKVPFYWSSHSGPLGRIEAKQDTIPGLEPDGPEGCESGSCWT